MTRDALALFSKQSLRMDMSLTDLVTCADVKRCQPSGSRSFRAAMISVGYALEPNPVQEANLVTHSIKPTISVGRVFQSWRAGVGTGGIHFSDRLKGLSSFCSP